MCGYPDKYKEVKKLLETYNTDSEHAYHVARLSCILFDELSKLSKLLPGSRHYLEMAALVHDIGTTISRKKHHKHSFDMIMSSDMSSITDEEKYFIALLAKYHRKKDILSQIKSVPSLTGVDVHLFNLLVAILRVADGLDHSHRQAVDSLKVEMTSETLFIRVTGQYIYQDDLDNAKKKSGLLGEIAGKNVIIKL